MEANKRQYQYKNGTSYIDGNTARKLRVAPDIRREEEQYEVPQRRRQEQKRPIALSGITFVTVYACMDYLKLQHEVSQMQKKIVTMEKNISLLSDKNDAAYEAVHSAIDLEHIYKVAVEELGMVYPNKNEVITYKKGSESYVRQYEDIPE
jgi:cell division protein FtsL